MCCYSNGHGRLMCIEVRSCGIWKTFVSLAGLAGPSWSVTRLGRTRQHATNFGLKRPKEEGERRESGGFCPGKAPSGPPAAMLRLLMLINARASPNSSTIARHRSHIHAIRVTVRTPFQQFQAAMLTSDQPAMEANRPIWVQITHAFIDTRVQPKSCTYSKSPTQFRS
jgi:hypothetical protein